MIPNKFVHNITFSVQLPYIDGHSLEMYFIPVKFKYIILFCFIILFRVIKGVYQMLGHNDNGQAEQV